ncbi:hypothetical protein HMPREF1508_0376 [Shuttleworthella sp. MSX8B]|nr:hypothetical protein HMPREF1508_0376 [Shuttleworthia sp. MSX8B]
MSTTEKEFSRRGHFIIENHKKMDCEGRNLYQVFSGAFSDKRLTENCTQLNTKKYVSTFEHRSIVPVKKGF